MEEIKKTQKQIDIEACDRFFISYNRFGLILNENQCLELGEWLIQMSK